MDTDVRKKNYTDTSKFKDKIQRLREAGVLEDSIHEYTDFIKEHFDFFGNDKGTDYTNVSLAYSIDGYTIDNGIVKYVG